MVANDRLSVPREAVIIGGGAMGTSVAYHLARAGVTAVTLLESGELGSGSSAKPLGGVRALFSQSANIALGARSLEAFRRFETEVGIDIGLQQVGYLFAIRDAGDVSALEEGVARQNAMGVPSRLVDPAEAVEHCPLLSPDELVAAVWSPGDGFARPADVVRGYAEVAAGLGVEIRIGTAVLDLTSGAGDALVRTADVTYRTPVVICTAGAWSAQIGAMAGIDLPISPLRRQIAFTPPVSARPDRLPFTIDYSSTAYFHGSEDGGLLLGWADPAEAVGFTRDVSTGWHESLRNALRRFAPAVADLPIVDGWAGLYEMTPDCNAIIGESDAGFRFLYAAGFSGHGFLQAPAVGECVRDLYLGRPPVIDLAPFALKRFDQPAVRTELGII
jgi:sarcosine oxidase subunit beta